MVLPEKRKNLIINYLVFLVLAISITGCTGQEDAQAQQVTDENNPGKSDINLQQSNESAVINTSEEKPLLFKGCTITRKAYMTEAASAYYNQTGKKITVLGGGAIVGIRATVAGDSDIGGTCRSPLPELFPEEEGAHVTQTAWDALVFITHKDNPVKGITYEQAKKIMLGDIKNWKELGGDDKDIVMAHQMDDEFSGTGFMARLILFNGTYPHDFLGKNIIVTNSGELEEFIAKTPYTFAVSGVSSSKKRNLTILTIDSIDPMKKENIMTAKYPLFRPLYIVTKGKPAGETKLFLDWLLSPEGQAVISAQGTVNREEGKLLDKKFNHWHNTHLIENYGVTG